jgi:hypothetical protein
VVDDIHSATEMVRHITWRLFPVIFSPSPPPHRSLIRFVALQTFCWQFVLEHPLSQPAGSLSPIKRKFGFGDFTCFSIYHDIYSCLLFQLDDSPFILSDTANEKKWGFRLQDSLDRARSRKIFEGLIFFISRRTVVSPVSLFSLPSSNTCTCTQFHFLLNDLNRLFSSDRGFRISPTSDPSWRGSMYCVSTIRLPKGNEKFVLHC